MVMIKNCVACGKKFETNRNARKFCSDDCRKSQQRKYASASYWEKKRSRGKKRTTNRLDEDSMMAREMGISYGKLQALRWAGKI